MEKKSGMPTWLIVLLVLIGIGLVGSLFNTNHSEPKTTTTTTNTSTTKTSSPSPITSKASTQDTYSPSTKRIVSQFQGCVAKRDLKDLIDYSRHHDDEAFNAALYEGLSNGTMDIFNVGDEVYVSDIGVFSGMLTVRRKGDTTKYWIVKEAVDY